MYEGMKHGEMFPEPEPPPAVIAPVVPIKHIVLGGDGPRGFPSHGAWTETDPNGKRVAIVCGGLLTLPSTVRCVAPDGMAAAVFCPECLKKKRAPMFSARAELYAQVVAADAATPKMRIPA